MVDVLLHDLAAIASSAARETDPKLKREMIGVAADVLKMIAAATQAVRPARVARRRDRRGTA